MGRLDLIVAVETLRAGKKFVISLDVRGGELDYHNFVSVPTRSEAPRKFVWEIERHIGPYLLGALEDFDSWYPYYTTRGSQTLLVENDYFYLGGNRFRRRNIKSTKPLHGNNSAFPGGVQTTQGG